jgi:glycosyltransferase involved in cell wall biosynthesis
MVSVVTPCYNGAAFIGECIESVLGQTYENFEYILVNNCSTDNTLQIMLDYASRDSRIRVHDNRRFLEVMVNHNHALRLISSSGKYCKCVSADDWIFPDCLQKMVEFAEGNPSVGVVGSYSLEEGGRLLFEGLGYHHGQVSDGRTICRKTLLGTQRYVFGAPTSVLYRADLIFAAKEFFPWADSNRHADVSAVYQALQHSDFGFVHQVLSFTRIHAASETSASFKSGSHVRALLADMAHFGPIYLSPSELRVHLGIASDKYYKWLVAALLENAFEKGFLETQRATLGAIGFELSSAKILKACLAQSLELIEHPAVVTKKVGARLEGRGKVVARGTSLT